MTLSRKLIVFLVASLFVTANAQTPRTGLPSALWAAAEIHGCDDLSDFFERVNTKDPPFVFGVLGNGSGSAVFVCRWREGDVPKLVIWQAPDAVPPSERFTCPDTIVQRNVIGGGLSLERRRVNLSHHSYLDSNQDEPFEPRWTRGPNVEVEKSTILASRGGVGTRVICHEGRWLYVNLD